MIKTYTVYNSETGDVIRTMTCTEETLLLNLEAGEAYIDFSFDGKTHRIVGGKLEPIPTSVSIEAEVREAEKSLRVARDNLLQKSDWTQAPDAPVDQAAWAAYRQQLRDLPANTQDPRNPVWPTPPA